MNNRKFYSQRETKTLSKFCTRSTHPERTHTCTAWCAAASNFCVADKPDGERCWHVTHITHTERWTDAYLGVCVCVCVQVMEELKVTAAASWRRTRLGRFIVPGSLTVTSYTESLLQRLKSQVLLLHGDSEVHWNANSSAFNQPWHCTGRMSVSWILLNESFLPREQRLLLRLSP